MRANRLRELWAAGEVVVNGWLHIPSGWSAEVMAHQGYDSLTVDLQHGLADFGDALAMLQAISTTATVPLARVPWNEPAAVMRLLDAGAYGIICPMVNSREECERFVAACRYPPAGIRSQGPTRARLYAGADYDRHADDEILAIAMVETAEGFDEVEAIAAVEGLDGVYVGPGDLTLSMGLEPRIDGDDPRYLAALDRIVAACRTSNVIPGIHTNDPDYARRMFGRGFRMVTVATDTILLSQATRASVAAVRGQEIP